MSSDTVLAHPVPVVLRRAAVRATLAPSVHNTQPWSLRVRPTELTIFADRSRRLPVLDPTGRQLTISCGCALFNARVSAAASGLGVRIARFPDGPSGAALARLDVDPAGRADEELARLDSVVELRQTNRRHFADDPVPDEVVSLLEKAAAKEDVQLVTARTPEQRVALAVLSQRADAVENLDPAYRAELRAWTTDDAARRDGVPNTVIPRVDGSAHDEIPIRDFDTRGDGGLPAETRSASAQCLMVLCTPGDTEADWLRSGEALERVLLEATRHGFAAGIFTQITEVAAVRERLREEFGLAGHPHLLLRIGRAARTPSTRRRRLVDVLVDET